MTCEDYLSMLETLPVQELTYGEAREHVACCAECNRVTRVVAARERNMTLAYSEAYPSASAVTVAERAIATARRRRIAFFYKAGLGAVTAVALAFWVMRQGVVPDGGRARYAARIPLQCVSAEVAVEFLRREMASDSILVRAGTSRLAVLDVVSSSAQELRRAQVAIDRFERSLRSQNPAACDAEVVLPRVDVSETRVAPGQPVEAFGAAPAKAPPVAAAPAAEAPARRR